ncbi:MAG: CYTH and CHAD domain-containing protein [Nitrospira sp. CG24B]|nr:MAG: CYTH and CHAD domain-containing protein [Nitrospira sp. CG24B]
MTQTSRTSAHHHRSSPITAKTERELKLTVAPGFRLPRLPGVSLPRKLVISTYYDTAAYDLAHARITLRHRIERGKKAWQLKIPLGEDRQEIEVAGTQADPPDSLRQLLMLHLGHRKLVPVVTLRVWRTGVLVRDRRRPLAEVVLDNVTVMKDGGVIQRFRELEIEQRQGDEASLRALERQMREAGASDHDGRPKLFRALSLPAPTLAAQPAPNAPIVDHLTWALAQHVRWLLAHDPGTRLGTEPESLHQLRVATRRLRAVLRTARPILLPTWVTTLEQELMWLSELLGPARDLDVQIAHFTEESAELDARDGTLLAPFIAHLRTQREAVQQMVVSELTGVRYVELIRRLQQAAQDPAVVESPLTVRDLARQEFKKLRKAISRLAPSPSDATLHKIRIKSKRARYAAELARSSVGKPASRFLKSARAVQDLLGLHQDALQAERHIRQFLKYSTSVRAGFVAGRMAERQRQRCRNVRKKIKPLFKSLLKRGKKAWE